MNESRNTMYFKKDDRIGYHDGRGELHHGRIEEVRDPGPHAVYRIRNELTNEIQVITHGQTQQGGRLQYSGGGSGHVSSDRIGSNPCIPCS
ncbi:hypothetical protein [Streptomyces sp. NPDC057939]|uniref:hypothetical protein n=1 Tax=Streptomyces sp. NPDC057939 TaxID=3346284 RepID=UPI0036E3186D